jgi:hypothetical protein
MEAETREIAQEQLKVFAETYGAKYPKAVASLQRDAEKLLTSYGFPAEHWQHIRSTNVIESAFRDGALAPARHEGRGVQDQGTSHGLQAARDGAAAMATDQRSTLGCVAPGRSALRGRSSEKQGTGGSRRLIKLLIHSF